MKSNLFKISEVLFIHLAIYAIIYLFMEHEVQNISGIDEGNAIIQMTVGTVLKQ